MTDPKTMQSEEEKKDEERLARYSKIINDNKHEILAIWENIKEALDNVLTDPIPFYENVVKLFFLIAERSNGAIIYQANDEVLDIGYVLAKQEWIEKVFFDEDSKKTQDFVEFVRSISYVPGELGGSDVFKRKLSPKGKNYFDFQGSYVRDFFFVSAMFECFFINKKDGEAQRISDFSVKKNPDLEGEIYKKSINLVGDYNLLKVLNYAIMDCVIKFVADLYVYVRRWKISSLHKSHPDVLAVFKKAVELFVDDTTSDKTQFDKAMELLGFVNNRAQEGSDLRYYLNGLVRDFDDSIARFAKTNENYSSLKRQAYFSTRNKKSLEKSMKKFSSTNAKKKIDGLKKMEYSNQKLQDECLTGEEFVKLISIGAEKSIGCLEKRRKLSRKKEVKLGLRNSEGKFRPYISLHEKDDLADSMVMMQKTFESASDKTNKSSATLSVRAKAKIKKRVEKFFNQLFKLMEIDKKKPEKNTKKNAGKEEEKRLFTEEKSNKNLLANAGEEVEQEEYPPASVKSAL